MSSGVTRFSGQCKPVAGKPIGEPFSYCLPSLVFIPPATDRDTWLLACLTVPRPPVRGNNPPLIDLTIAALALRNSLALFTRDGHFHGSEDLRIEAAGGVKCRFVRLSSH